MALKEIVSMVVVLALLAALGEAKHIHPRKDHYAEELEERVIALNNDLDAAETEVENIAPKRLFPQNSILFFKSYNPCEDGFELDYQGICREVWF